MVIGSGFGGLAAAVRLGARGYSVTVLDKLDAPGGRAYVHRQDGFTFDAGPTVITAPFLFVRHVLADDFSLYLHRPTATDPSLAPEGCDTFYVLSPVPNLLSGTDWSACNERYRRSIEALLERTVLPGLKESIVTSRLLTPQDFQDRLLSYRGAAFGLEPVLTQSAFFRPHNASEEVRGLYLVGAGTHPGAGLPGVLSSARVLDRVVPDAASVV